MSDNACCVEWYEVNWSTKPFTEGDTTEVRVEGNQCVILRPMEYQAFRNLQRQARLVINSGGRYELNVRDFELMDDEWSLIERDVDPDDILHRLAIKHGKSPEQIESWLNQISYILESREKRGISGFPSPQVLGYTPLSKTLRMLCASSMLDIEK